MWAVDATVAPFGAGMGDQIPPQIIHRNHLCRHIRQLRLWPHDAPCTALVDNFQVPDARDDSDWRCAPHRRSKLCLVGGGMQSFQVPVRKSREGPQTGIASAEFAYE